MSMSQQYGNRSGGEAAEDCRDYLRTGRCKYGASCKYNHPSNVQSGGGMRTPIDPSEPMFPIRPNEPVCQYYMKHGTCKFGQSCRFHHPPQSPLPGVVAGPGGPMMNAGRKSDAPLVLNPVGTDPNGGSMMLQFLPQRPDEPDCIFFLKNGRCKYGATCRYHHPINYHQRRVDDSSRRAPSHEGQQKLQYIIPQHGFPRGQVVVSDSPVTIMSLDGSSVPQGYQILTSSDGTRFCAPIGTSVVTEQSSAASSLSTSYETASMASQGDMASALWNRSKRNGSVNSLKAYTDSSGHGMSQGRSMPVLHQSGSDGSLRRQRAPSYGSAGDTGLSYYETSPQVPNRAAATMGAWRGDNPLSFEQSRRLPLNQYGVRQDDIHSDKSNETKSPSMIGRPPPTTGSRQPMAGARQRRGPRSGENDEGFTMLTSALLNMLDTPDEAAEHYLHEEFNAQPPPYAYPQEDFDPAMFERLSLGTSEAVNYGHAPPPPGLGVDDQGGESRVVPPRHSHQSPNSPGGSDVGLYLP